MDLYDRLSYYLFGTEEIVDIRRKLGLLRERLRNDVHDNLLRLICSGSLGEGLSYPKSDDDFMVYNDKSRIVRKWTDAVQKYDLVLANVKNSPGYCLLIDKNGSYAADIICSASGQSIVSSSLLKQKNCKFVGDRGFVHGPCWSVSVGTEEFDCAFCIPCTFWPDIACDWINRKRPYGWPSHEIIQTIVRNRCHVVPVGDPDSSLYEHSWRISFSVAERTLIHSFNHVQFLTYSLLRLTLKRVINRHAPDVFCSYFMKTTLFYTSENTSRRLWKFDNLDECFKICVATLYDFVRKMVCPSYFIPEYNLIKRKINLTNQQCMLNILRHLHTIGVVGCVHLSGESQCLEDDFTSQVMEWKTDRELLYSIHHYKLMARIEIDLTLKNSGFGKNFTDPLWKYVRVFTGNEMFRGNTYFYFLLYEIISFYSKKMMHHLLGFPRQNKKNYCIHKFIQSLLQVAHKMNVTTGKLTTATYLFISGKTGAAFCVIKQLLSNYPAYAMDGLYDRNQISTYIDVMCGKGYTIYYKARHSWVPHYAMPLPVLNAFPTPLKILLAVQKSFCLHPLTYACLLASLCCFKQRDLTSFSKWTRSLMQLIRIYRDVFSIATAKICIGILRYTQGEKNSACRWFGSAFTYKRMLETTSDDKICLSVLIYVACIINRYRI